MRKMSYEFILDGVTLPVTPSKLEKKIDNKNKTVTLINYGEVNLLKDAGLTELSFDVLLPNVEYPFAVYPDKKFLDAAYYLEKIEKLKLDLKPFKFEVKRTFPKGRRIFDTIMDVSLEEYKIVDDAKNGFDIMVNIKLKQYRAYETTKGVKVKETDEKTEDGETVVHVEEEREKSTSPEPKEVKTYTVVKGDTLWAIAKKYYNDGQKYKEIAKANNIANPDLILIGQVIKLPVLS